MRISDWSSDVCSSDLINEAYEVLKDPQKRAAYDRFGKSMPNGFGGGGADFGDIGDIFESIFGSAFGGRQQQRGPARGADLRYDMEIRREDDFTGCSREIQVDVAERCAAGDGTGAKPGNTHPTARKSVWEGQRGRVHVGIVGRVVT